MEALVAQRAQALERTRLYEEERLRADEANRAKSEFLAVMSHELRTPLNAIGGHVQLLEMEIHGPIAQAQRDALARVAHNQRHLLRLINDVLNLSRIETGRVEYQLEDLTLADIVADVGPMIEPQLAAKGIAYFVDVPRSCVVRADGEKLEQILINLLGNAAKFTPGGGRVSISCGSWPDAPPGTVALQVTDSGPGIPAAKLDAIFEPFVQVETSRARRADGVGLGLAISRDLVRGMGGDLRVRSEPGQGATFVVLLHGAAPVGGGAHVEGA